MLFSRQSDVNVITPEGIDGATGWLSIDPAAVDDSSSLLRFHFLPFFGNVDHKITAMQSLMAFHFHK